jgi:energy-coupling factor transport system substrate-specific component
MAGSKKTQITTKELAVMGLMVALLEAAVHAMAALPNVEPVTLLLMLYTLFLGPKVMLVVAAYLLLEGCFYGFGLWWLSYLYIWPLLVWLTWLLRKQRSFWPFAILSGFFGLLFGALCTIPYLFISGPAGAFGWWVAGIPFDLVHGISNFFLCLVLFTPLRRCMQYLKKGVFK